MAEIIRYDAWPERGFEGGDTTSVEPYAEGRFVLYEDYKALALKLSSALDRVTMLQDMARERGGDAVILAALLREALTNPVPYQWRQHVETVLHAWDNHEQLPEAPKP